MLRGGSKNGSFKVDFLQFVCYVQKVCQCGIKVLLVLDGDDLNQWLCHSQVVQAFHQSVVNLISCNLLEFVCIYYIYIFLLRSKESSYIPLPPS